jgi:prophage regulatory protein
MATQPRFLTLPDVAAELALSQSQMYALVKSGDRPAIQAGGRGQWRVERVKLKDYIARMYEQAEKQRGKMSVDDIATE